MAQRLTQLFRWFYGVESTEGTEVLGTATEAFLVAGQPSLSLSRDIHRRMFQGQMGNKIPVVGGQPDQGLAFSCELRSRGATSVVPEIDELYKTVFGTRTLDTGAGVDAGTSSSTVVVMDDTSNFTAGNAIMVETGSGTGVYELGWISSVDSGTNITLAQALTFTPASGATYKPTLTFKLTNSGHQSLSFQDWVDATDYFSFVGCKGSASFDFPGAGAIPMVNFNWKAWNWTLSTSGSRPSQTFGDVDTGSPPVLVSGEFHIDGTATDVHSMSLDLNQEISRVTSHNSTYGTAGLHVTNWAPTATIKLYNDGNTRWTDAETGTAREITHQVGNTQYDTVGVRLPRFYQDGPPQPSDENGIATMDVTGHLAYSSGADDFYLAFG